MDFKEWLGSDPTISELLTWINPLKQKILASIHKSEGFVYFSIGSLASQNYHQIAASTVHDGDIIQETPVGWKGPAAIAAVDAMGGNWNTKDKNTFSKAMSGRKSLPVIIGREMGLLFEVEIFIFLIQNFKLKAIGHKDLAWAIGEQNRLSDLIFSKTNKNLGRLAIDFIKQHAISNRGMAQLIYNKAKALIRECVVNSIQFLGGEGSTGTGKLRDDTADLRIGCGESSQAARKDIGFSLKAVTETHIEVRTLSGLKSLYLLGGGPKLRREMKNTFTNPLYEAHEKRNALMEAMHKLAENNYKNKPKKFASLLEILVTGGADTIPAYRMLLHADSTPGWSPMLSNDFSTKEGPGRKINAKSGLAPEVNIIKNATYVKIIYMSSEGNRFGTSVVFEPDSSGSYVSVVVSNLLGKGSKN